MESGAVCAAERSPPPESFIITCYVVAAIVLLVFGGVAVWLSTKMPQSTKDTGVGSLSMWPLILRHCIAMSRSMS
jgi:hypothetical protein